MMMDMDSLVMLLLMLRMMVRMVVAVPMTMFLSMLMLMLVVLVMLCIFRMRMMSVMIQLCTVLLFYTITDDDAAETAGRGAGEEATRRPARRCCAAGERLGITPSAFLMSRHH